MSWPRTVRTPARRMEEAEQQPDRRRLAGAVRAEEAEDLARLDRRGRGPPAQARAGGRSCFVSPRVSMTAIEENPTPWLVVRAPATRHRRAPQTSPSTTHARRTRDAQDVPNLARHRGRAAIRSRRSSRRTASSSSPARSATRRARTARYPAASRPRRVRCSRTSAACSTRSGSTYADVVKCTVYLRDFGDFGAMNEVYREFFPTGRRRHGRPSA